MVADPGHHSLGLCLRCRHGLDGGEDLPRRRADVRQAALAVAAHQMVALLVGPGTDE